MQKGTLYFLIINIYTLRSFTKFILLSFGISPGCTKLSIYLNKLLRHEKYDKNILYLNLEAELQPNDLITNNIKLGTLSKLDFDIGMIISPFLNNKCFYFDLYGDIKETTRILRLEKDNLTTLDILEFISKNIRLINVQRPDQKVTVLLNRLRSLFSALLIKKQKMIN